MARQYIKINDKLAGLKFGRLTVVKLNKVVKGNDKEIYWYDCVCDCGNTCIRNHEYLKYSRKNKCVPSCGCSAKESFNESINKRYKRLTFRPEYKIWLDMRARCFNPSEKCYHNYGGRGITVCDRWRDSFENFLADMGDRPSEEYSLDRIDVDGDYEPTNCRWATQKEQMRNTRVNLNVTYKGETKTFVEWCEIYNMDYLPAYKTYKRGFRTFDEIVNTYQDHKRRRYFK